MINKMLQEKYKRQEQQFIDSIYQQYSSYYLSKFTRKRRIQKFKKNSKNIKFTIKVFYQKIIKTDSQINILFCNGSHFSYKQLKNNLGSSLCLHPQLCKIMLRNILNNHWLIFQGEEQELIVKNFKLKTSTNQTIETLKEMNHIFKKNPKYQQIPTQPNNIIQRVIEMNQIIKQIIINYGITHALTVSDIIYEQFKDILQDYDLCFKYVTTMIKLLNTH